MLGQPITSMYARVSEDQGLLMPILSCWVKGKLGNLTVIDCKTSPFLTLSKEVSVHMMHIHLWKDSRTQHPLNRLHTRKGARKYSPNFGLHEVLHLLATTNSTTPSSHRYNPTLTPHPFKDLGLNQPIHKAPT